MQPRDMAALRLELNIDHMKLAIMRALEIRQEELEAMVAHEVARMDIHALFAHAIRNKVQDAILDALEPACQELIKDIGTKLKHSLKESLNG